MKKLITFSSLFALLILFLAGCQKSLDVTSSGDNLNKPGPYEFVDCGLTALNESGTATVDLVAGQHNVVGSATFTLDAEDSLHISYNVSGGTITEVHIDFAQYVSPLTNDANDGGFHANSQGSPQPGHFDINTTSGSSSWSTVISKADLLGYLNLSSGDPLPSDFYIAAHGVIEGDGGSGSGTCPTLENGHYRDTTTVPGTYYYMENAEIKETSDQSSPVLYTLNGWCVDRENGAAPGSVVQVDFLCSTEDVSGLCLVDYPDNIGAVNWVLNNKVVSDEYAPYRTVQVVIWKLLDASTDNFAPYDTADVDQLYAEALTHTGFVPQCGDIIGVFMYETGVDYCTEGGMQVFLVEQPVECGFTGTETMWGFNYEDGPVDGESCRFVDQGNWARYFLF